MKCSNNGNKGANKADNHYTESETRYRALFDNANDAIFLMDFDRFIECNNKTLEIFDCTSEQIIGKKPYDPFSPQFQSDGRKSDEKALEKIQAALNGQPQRFEWSHLRCDGSQFDAEVSLNRIVLGGKTFLQAIVRDITKRKKAEKRLRESEDKYRSVIENANTGIIVIQDGKQVFFNQKIPDMIGYTKEEYNDLDLMSTVHPDDKAYVTDQIKRRLSGELTGQVSMEVRALSKSGEVIWIVANSTVIEWEGKPAIQAFITDISERKKAQEITRQSEEKYHSLVNNIPGVVWTTDENGNTTFISSGVEEIYGYKPEEIYEAGEQLWFGRIHPDDIEKVKVSFKAVFEKGQPLDVEYRLKKKDGQWIWIHDRSIGAYEKDGVNYADGVFFDITERKKAEAALAESEQRFRKFFENEPEYCYMVSPQGNVLEANSAALNILGYSKEELVGKPLKAIYAPESRKKMSQLFESWQNTGEIRDEEIIIITKNGDKRTVLLSAAQVLNEEGKILHSISIQRDITERKKAEEVIKQEKEFAESMFNTAPVIMLVLDTDASIVNFNPYMEEISGYTLEEVRGKDWFDTFLPKRDHARIREVFKQAISNMDTRGNINPIVAKDRREVLVEWYSKTLKDKNDQVIGLISIGQDITERKKAEETLAKAENEKATILNTMSELVVYQDTEHKVIWANRAACESVGLTADKLIGHYCYEIWQGRNKSCEDCPVEKTWKTGRLETGEIQSPDSRIWSICANPVKNEAGNVIGGVEITLDITEHKKAENKLRAYQNDLRSLASKLTTTEASQRRQIAAGLHDNVSQALALSINQLRKLRKSVVLADAKKLDRISRTIESAMQSVRDLTFDLASPTLYKIGLEAAISELLNEQLRDRHGINCNFSDDNQDKPLDDNVRILLFQAVRELLVNVVKHAKSKNVEVAAQRKNDNIQISVSDDGIGFDTHEVESSIQRDGGFGLFSIRERIDYIGGTFEIHSQPGSGSRFVLTAPLKSLNKVAAGGKQ